jgi:hypothetical protein
MKTKKKKKPITDKQLQKFIANEIYKLGMKLDKVRPNDEQYCLYLLFSMFGGLLSNITCKKHFKQIVA